MAPRPLRHFPAPSPLPAPHRAVSAIPPNDPTNRLRIPQHSLTFGVESVNPMKLRPVTHWIILLPASAALLVAAATAEPANQDTRPPDARNPEPTPAQNLKKGQAKPANRLAKKQQRKSIRPVPARATPQPAAKPGDPNRPVIPFETANFTTPVSQIDRLVLAELQKNDIRPARPCSDEVFIRRVYLDVIGTLPDPKEVQ